MAKLVTISHDQLCQNNGILSNRRLRQGIIPWFRNTALRTVILDSVPSNLLPGQASHCVSEASRNVHVFLRTILEAKAWLL